MKIDAMTLADISDSMQISKVHTHSSLKHHILTYRANPFQNFLHFMKKRKFFPTKWYKNRERNEAMRFELAPFLLRHLNPKIAYLSGFKWS